jgi:hypothetical protein
MLDVQAVGPDLADPSGPGPRDGFDEVVLAPDLDRGLVHEDVEGLHPFGEKHQEAL